MDLMETKIYAGEQIIRSLCSGRDFRGLGKEAEHLVRVAAQGAYENAQLISDITAGTRETFSEMNNRARDQFVLDILGFGETRLTPQEAAYKLVETVWDAYISWARAA